MSEGRNTDVRAKKVRSEIGTEERPFQYNLMCKIATIMPPLRAIAYFNTKTSVMLYFTVHFIHINAFKSISSVANLIIPRYF